MADPFRSGPLSSSFQFKGGRGAFVYDSQDREYLDLTSGWNVMNAGWNSSEIIKEVHSCLASNPFRPSWCADESSRALTELLAQIAPGYTPIFSCTGGEAVDNSLKLARLVTGHGSVITFTGAYHGSTTGAALAAGLEVPHITPLNLSESTFRIRLPPDDPPTIKTFDKFEGDVGAVIVETIATNAGCYKIPEVFLRQLRQLARDLGALFICDEIGTGINRVGALFSSLDAGLSPDVILCGKALTNGLYPLSLCLVTNRLLSYVDEGAFGSTYAGAPLGCTAALATLNYHHRNQLGSITSENGSALKQRLLSNLGANPLVSAVSGEGLELAINLNWNLGASIDLTPLLLVTRLRELGLFSVLSADCDLMVIPPLITPVNELLRAADLIADVLRA